jgi:hypothetical protein
VFGCVSTKSPTKKRQCFSETQNTKYECWESEIGDGIALEYKHLGEEEPLTHSISLISEQQVSLAAFITILRKIEQNERFANAGQVHDARSSNNSVARGGLRRPWRGYRTVCEAVRSAIRHRQHIA